jgi:hypothetical protein
MNVYQRLNAARQKFHTLKLSKSGHNKFAGYYYFELGDFLIPALGVFAEFGLCAIVTFEATTASMIIRNAEKPEETIVLTSPMGSAALKGCHEVQNIGAVETYQRRYLWVMALEIVEHDALDATLGKKGAQAEPAGDSERQAELDELALYLIDCHQNGNDTKAIELWYEPKTWSADNPTESEEKKYVWGQLGRHHSALRAAIKANHPDRKPAEQAA